MAKRHCLDCNKEISRWNAVRCHKCANFIITRSFVGKKLSAKHKRKLKDSWDYEKHITESWIKKQREIHKGTPVIPVGSRWSEKQRKSIMEAKKPWTDERRKYYSEMHKGNKAYQWIEDRSTLRQRPGPEYKEWQRKVFERDNYTCQKCGYKGHNIQCHHIKSYILYPEFRFDVDNGQTLCVSCHRKTDTWGLNRKYLDKIKNGV